MPSDFARRPLIAGVGQIVQRVEDPREALSPVELMERAVRAAAQDAGAPKLVESLDAIYVPRGLWKYGDAGRLISERLGSPAARTLAGAISGHIVQLLVNRACAKIAQGEADVIAIVGGESEHSRRRLERRSLPLPWNEAVAGEPDDLIGKMKFVATQDEQDAGILNASSVFSLAETALRCQHGETPAAHRDRIAALMARLARIAEENPYAWIRRAPSAEEIRDPGPGNRMVSYPYTKLMTSNIAVDQSAALIICSAEAAGRFGVPDGKRVYLRASTEMSHTILLSERESLAHHRGQQLAADRVLELAGRQAADLEYVDLYSCFPFAVQAGAAALGLPTDPAPSLTGGMTFFGGPFGNYVLHSKATMVERLRADPGATGVIGSVGGSFAHFAYGLYSTEPGESVLPPIEDLSQTVAALERHSYREGYSGPITTESYCVTVLHEGPYQACFAALTDAGERVWGRSHDRDLMASLLADEEGCGLRGRLRDGLVELG